MKKQLNGLSSPAPTRYHDLDALRAFAMLLGIVLHACLFLMPVDTWPVQDRWAGSHDLENNPYAFVFGVIHGFRMPVFYLISGFFTVMLWQSRGLVGLARHRLYRIGLPLLAGTLTIIPVTNAFFIPMTPLTWMFSWLSSLAHLWFLWYLVLMAAVFIACARLGLRFRHPAWWLLVPASIIPQFLMREGMIGADGSAELIPILHVFGYYLVFYLFGAFFYQKRIEVRKWWSAGLAPAILVFMPAGYLLLDPESLGLAPSNAVKGTAAAIGAAYTWLACFGLLGLFRWIASKQRYWVRYVSDASYWLYLGHLPLVLGGQELAVSWSVSVHLKFALICLAVTGILLATYQIGVRYTFVGRVLNGPRVRHGPEGSRYVRNASS